MYFDAHTHLNDERLYRDWKTYLTKFIQSDGRGLVNVGASWDYNFHAMEISKEIESVAFFHSQGHFQGLVYSNAFGLHPLEVVEGHVTEQNIEEECEKLSDSVVENRKYCVAIGECGIDLYYQNTSEILELEKKLFTNQCEIAKKLNLPIMIHSRAGFEETLEILQNYKDLKIYFHCRGYGPEEIRKLQTLFPNLWVGFAGNVTYKNAENLRESLKVVPLDRLLLETDAPYLTPQVIRGELNHPANVKHVYQFVSEFLGIEMKKLCQRCEKNFREYYNL